MVFLNCLVLVYMGKGVFQACMEVLRQYNSAGLVCNVFT